MSTSDRAPPPPAAAPPGAPHDRGWTRLEDYLDLARLWRRSSNRHRRRLKPRTELSAPRLVSLGMLPFVLLMAAMALLSALIIVAAVPGKHAPERPPEPPPPGTAPKGWL